MHWCSSARPWRATYVVAGDGPPMLAKPFCLAIRSGAGAHFHSAESKSSESESRFGLNIENMDRALFQLPLNWSGQQVSSWMALRASVLRRAISQPVVARLRAAVPSSRAGRSVNVCVKCISPRFFKSESSVKGKSKLFKLSVFKVAACTRPLRPVQWAHAFRAAARH